MGKIVLCLLKEEKKQFFPVTHGFVEHLYKVLRTYSTTLTTLLWQFLRDYNTISKHIRVAEFLHP